MPRTPHASSDGPDAFADPIPFPRVDMTAPAPGSAGSARRAGEQVLDAIDTISRRIDVLARELGCLGFFDDDDDDRPRAA